GAKGKPYLGIEQLTDFINLKQRDSRLNEVLYPPLKKDQVRQLIEKYEPNKNFMERDQISVEGFSCYLGGDENCIVPPEKLDNCDDMTQPLSHYFINSSHNTYLTAGQLTGLSSVEMYRQVLLTGCRCIELDCWKGRPNDEEPFITHGFTMTTEIPFKEVIEAIAESAFKTSPYPVILSFENHVDSPTMQPPQSYSVGGQRSSGKLIVKPAGARPDHMGRWCALVPGQALPTPQDLLGKILIKNKKKHPHKVSEGSIKRRLAEQGSNTYSDTSSIFEQPSPNNGCPLQDAAETGQLLSNGEEKMAERLAKEGQPRKSIDLAMQLNMGFFEYNGRSGYVLKPEFMRRTDKHFDPFTENIVDGIVANTVKIKIISGQFLTDKKVGVHVEVDMFGLPVDTKRKFRTKTSANGNSLNPVWDDEPFVFSKVVLPTLASLRIAVFEENGKFIGHRIMQVSAIRPGYHYICLKNELNQPLMLPTLLVYTEAKDYIPDEHQDVQAQSIEDLRQQKGFLKLQRKQYKELKELKRKHMKKISKMNKEQNARINQMTSESMRRKSQVEKNLKRSIKKNADESSAAIEKELSALEAEVSQKNVELKEWQMKELLEVREKQFQLEGTKKRDHFKQAQEKLKDTAKDCQAVQLKKLKEICEKELNEINRKHINESVTLIRRLDEAQKKRHDKLLLQHKDILQQIGEEQPLLLARLEKESDAEFRRLPQEIRTFLQGELNAKMHQTDGYDNGRANTDSSGPPSNQSTPSFSPASRGWLSGRSLDKSGRSLDNSLASLADDDSLGIPAASEGELSVL
ncbi:UNVERIFIED_CONTAM: hypothetical protein FKN15_012604, partial [Acipenser sinensis]